MTPTTMTWLGDETAPRPPARTSTDPEDAQTPEAEVTAAEITEGTPAGRGKDRDDAAPKATEGTGDTDVPAAEKTAIKDSDAGTSADATRAAEKTDRADRAEPAEKTEKAEKAEKAERVEQAERSGKTEKTERVPSAAADADRDDAPDARDADTPTGKAGDEDSPAAAKSRTGRRWHRPTKAGAAKAAALAALAAAVAVAGLQWHRANGMAEEEAVRTAVRTRAAEFGVALLSYDHTDLKAAREKVMSMASDDFAKTYDVAFTGGLEGVIGRLKADATATVRNVYVGEVNDTTAKAVVVLDSEVKSTAGTRRVLGSYLEMSLVRQGGQWKVTEVSSIGSINESMSGSDGQSPSPSPTPSSSPRR